MVPAGETSVAFVATAGSITANGTVTITAKDGNSESMAIQVVPSPSPQLAITTNNLTEGQVKLAYSATLAATGGTPPYSWAISSGQLPIGLLLAPSTGVISGTPTAAGSASFSVEVTDKTGATATANLNIQIAAASSSGSQVTLNSVQLLILNDTSGIPQTINATRGNLIVVSWIFGPGDYVTRITDNKGNNYVSAGANCDATWGAGVCGI